MKFTITICFFVTTFCYAQNEALFEIINSDSNLELREQRIDSLLAVNKQNLSPIQLADFYHDLANKWFFDNWWDAGNQKDIEKAIFCTEMALELKKGHDGLKEGSLERTWYNLGYFHFMNEEVYEAINIYKSLIKNGKGNLVQKANFELGISYSFIGDFYKALERFNEFIAFYRAKDSLNKKESLFLIDGYIKKAETYAKLSDNGFSEEIKTQLISADSILKIKKIIDQELYNLINHMEGTRLLRTGNYTGAIRSYRKILKDSSSLNFNNLARLHNSIATSQIELQDFDRALANLNIAIYHDPNHANSYERLGEVYLAKKEFERGLFFFQKAIIYATNKKNEIKYEDIPTIKDLELVPDKVLLLNHIVTKANGWIKYYKYDNNKEHLAHALESFTLADQLVDLIRFESTEHQSKLFWREKGASLYMKAVEVSYLLHKPEVAYYFMERNKALLLLEDLTNEEAKEITNLPQELAQYEFNLKRKIFLSENNLQEADASDPVIIGHLKDTIRENKYRYQQFVDSLNESYPDYAKFKKKAPVLAFKDLKTNYVSDNRGVLHYILNEEQGYGLLTLSDTTLLFQMNDIPTLNKDVETLIATLSNGVSDIHKFHTVSNRVFRQLIPENIFSNIRGKQLLIVPDYTLQRIPFEALVVSEAVPKYMIEDIEIGYTYSASLLEYTQRTEKNAAKNFVGFAPIQFTDLDLSELHFSENEIKGIESIFSGETMMNGQASKSNFIKNVNQHKIVHLATHADIGDGENPWIAFSDSKMYLKEIYATRNQADMVVLSACNTSNGSLRRGEGIMSLARGFFYSGSKSVVSSLWPIEDEAGKDILIDFYTNLGRGDSKSKALQNAKLAYLRTTSEKELKHPFYWAGFVVMGDNTPIVQAFNWLWIILSMGLLVLTILVYRFRSIKFFQ